MEYRNLGNSGLQVSLLGLGTNQFGTKVDLAGAIAIVNRCIEMGITLFDTADRYGGQQSEALLGAALKPHRRNVVLATKSSAPMGDGPYWQGASRKYLLDAVDACLKRLDTDYIDLYQIHFPDAKTPIEETLRSLEDMVRSGRVRYVGSSNFSAWQVVEAEWTARSEHLTRFISAQNEYSLLERGVENDLTQVCQQYGIGLLPFYPLASGFLTGKYRPREQPPADARLAGNTLMSQLILTNRNYDLLEKLEAFAHARGHEMLDLAIGWLASKPSVGSVIAGATRPEQVVANASAAAWRLTAEEIAEVETILEGVG